MKNQPTNKKAKYKPEKYEIVELPAEDTAMREYVETHREEINERIVHNIYHAISKRLDAVELFCFKNSSYVVVLNRKDFKENLENIYEFSLDNEQFEVCGKVLSTIDKMDKMSHIFTYKKTK